MVRTPAYKGGYGERLHRVIMYVSLLTSELKLPMTIVRRLHDAVLMEDPMDLIPAYRDGSGEKLCKVIMCVSHLPHDHKQLMITVRLRRGVTL
jgi:hypothetical protein